VLINGNESNRFNYKDVPYNIEAFCNGAVYLAKASIVFSLSAVVAMSY
jgi:hypothetical protein